MVLEINLIFVVFAQFHGKDVFIHSCCPRDPVAKHCFRKDLFVCKIVAKDCDFFFVCVDTKYCSIDCRVLLWIVFRGRWNTVPNNFRAYGFLIKQPLYQSDHFMIVAELFADRSPQ